MHVGNIRVILTGGIVSFMRFIHTNITIYIVGQIIIKRAFGAHFDSTTFGIYQYRA